MSVTTPNVEEDMKSNLIDLNKVDHISQLPDCILSLILTKLSIKDFLKNRLLSTRWSNLWTLRRDFYFDIFNVFEYTEQQLLQKGYLIDDTVHSSFSSEVVRRLDLDITRVPFVKLVDQFLKHSNATIIDSFAVNFYLDSRQQRTIDEWISFVIARGVGRIDLLFCGSPYTVRHRSRKPYKFPLHLFFETNASTLKHLCLEYCLLYLPTNYDFTSFKNLSFLSLKEVKVDEIFLESLLSNSTQLEELHLIECEFKSSMPKIVSSSLHKLKVTLCYVLFRNYQVDVNLTSLDCLKLTSLEYNGFSLDNMNFNTPILKNFQLHVSKSEHLNAFRLLETLPMLENLQLDIFSMVPTSLKITQRLEHLKELNLILIRPLDLLHEIEFNLLGILTILQACPLLQKLSVMVTYPKMIEGQKVVTDVEAFSHEEVKVIELRGCVGNWYEFELAMNVMQYAHKLERIVLSPYWRDIVESSDWSSDPAWFQNGRQRISEKFQSEKIVHYKKNGLRSR